MTPRALALACALASASATTLDRHFFDSAKYPNAVCNDGSPAGMFFRASPTGSKAWVVYLEVSALLRMRRFLVVLPSRSLVPSIALNPLALVPSPSTIFLLLLSSLGRRLVLLRIELQRPLRVPHVLQGLAAVGVL